MTNNYPYTLLIDPPAGTPGITSATTASGTAGTAFTTYTVTADNSPTSFNVGSLPPGLVLGGTATAGLDYTDPTAPTVLTLTLPAGQTVATFQIPVNEDLLVEGDETALLQLSNPTGGGAELGDVIDATLTIADATPFFGFSLTNFTVSENVGDAQIVVRRSGDTFGAASVVYTVVANGSATADELSWQTPTPVTGVAAATRRVASSR